MVIGHSTVCIHKLAILQYLLCTGSTTNDSSKPLDVGCHRELSKVLGV